MSIPENNFLILLQHQKYPQKVRNEPKIKSNSKVRIEGSIENESCSTILVDHKTIF